jgi:mRNA interferase MazF
MISAQWDVVRVPFPFTDRAALKKRPALVVSARTFNIGAAHTIMAMITKRDHSAWPQDYDIEDWEKAGLKFPSWVRMKIFTLENSLIIDTLGRFQAADIAGVKAAAGPVLRPPDRAGP